MRLTIGVPRSADVEAVLPVRRSVHDYEAAAISVVLQHSTNGAEVVRTRHLYGLWGADHDCLCGRQLLPIANIKVIIRLRPIASHDVVCIWK